MKIYKVTKWNNKEIEVLEIQKQTDKTIWIINKNGTIRQERKESNYYRYFETFEDAKNYLLNKINNSIENFKNKIDESYNELKIVSDLKEK